MKDALLSLIVSHPFNLKQPFYGVVAEISLGIYALTGIVFSPEVLVILTLIVPLVAYATVLLVRGISLFGQKKDEQTVC